LFHKNFLENKTGEASKQHACENNKTGIERSIALQN